jgi:alpha/beta superfamily hydrolase
LAIDCWRQVAGWLESVYHFAMAHVELVQVRTADGVRLDGALSVPKHGDSKHAASHQNADDKAAAQLAGDAHHGAVDAVLAIHGTGSNFYAATVLEGLTPKLLADGMTVLRANTRGHDAVSMAATLHGPRRLGSSFEIVDECRHDIVAWCEFLTSRGCKSIALLGHSLGAIKSIYSVTHQPHPAVTRLIAISPPRLSHQYYLESEKREEFAAQYKLAQEHVAAGKGDTLSTITTPLPFLVSAKSFLDKYGPDEKYNFLRYLNAIKLPTVFVFGGVELEEVNFRGLTEAVAAGISPGQKIDAITIDGANHVYTGRIDELAFKIRTWLAKS